MDYDQFLGANKEELLNLYSEIYSGKEIELFINDRADVIEFEISCCFDVIVCVKYHDSKIDFPLTYDSKNISNEEHFENEHLALNLHSLVLCEEAVKKGKLIRDGLKYSPADGELIKNPKRYGKYYINADI